MIATARKPVLQWLLCTLVWLTGGGALGQLAIEERSFANAEQKARYNDLIADLRCPKCLNSNLAGSDAPIAADLRNEIHAQITAGRSDTEILDYLVERYGEFVLYDPPLHPGTALLWFGPPVLLLLGVVIVRRMLAVTAPGAAPAALTPAEQQRLQDLLKQQSES
ncbi:MAG: cytochrome c-type biogenesis protein [Pseudohongiellaceae bacterium]|jgi:cytochrome c-type biogenesis protein CcmH